MPHRTLLSATMDIDSPTYSRWSYATSFARSEPSIPYATLRQTTTKRTPQPVRCPPPTNTSSPVQTSPGVWEDEDGLYYSSNWPLVQEYLNRIRKERRMLVAPSEIIFVLAALDVVYSPWDVAHWIFWPSSNYYCTADRVTAIALQQPKLIITKVPWIGSREHKWIINAVQEKYYYVHILGRWYPTDFQPLETKKRALRSNGGLEDRLDMTVNQFFNIVEDGLPTPKRQRRTTKKIAESQLSSDKRPRGGAQRKSTIITPSESLAQPEKEEISTSNRSASTSTPRSGLRVRQPTTPASTDTSTMSTSDSETNLIPSYTSDLALSSLHSRNRSISQSSEQTVIAEEPDPRRSTSVESASTAVASSTVSKKRKLEALEDTNEEGNQEQSDESAPLEGMITRRRSRIALDCREAKRKSTQISSPIAKKTKLTPKPKSRKPRS